MSSDGVSRGLPPFDPSDFHRWKMKIMAHFSAAQRKVIKDGISTESKAEDDIQNAEIYWKVSASIVDTEGELATSGFDGASLDGRGLLSLLDKHFGTLSPSEKTKLRLDLYKSCFSEVSIHEFPEFLLGFRLKIAKYKSLGITISKEEQMVLITMAAPKELSSTMQTLSIQDSTKDCQE